MTTIQIEVYKNAGWLFVNDIQYYNEREYQILFKSPRMSKFKVLISAKLGDYQELWARVTEQDLLNAEIKEVAHDKYHELKGDILKKIELALTNNENEIKVKL